MEYRKNMDVVPGGPGAGEEGAGERSEDRQDGRRLDMRVLDLVFPQTKTAMLTTVKTRTSRSAACVAQRRHAADESDEADGEQRGEADSDTGTAPCRMDPAEAGRQDLFAAHAVDETARHQQLDEG